MKRHWKFALSLFKKEVIITLYGDEKAQALQLQEARKFCMQRNLPLRVNISDFEFYTRYQPALNLVQELGLELADEAEVRGFRKFIRNLKKYRRLDQSRYFIFDGESDLRSIPKQKNKILIDYLSSHQVFSAIPTVQNTSVFINNRDRLTTLKQLILWLEKKGFQQITVIDNASTYPPLLEYYENELRHRLIRLEENIGYLSLWETDIFSKDVHGYYLYTDSDIIPADDCPDDFLQIFYRGLIENPDIDKVGFSLRIEDLPDHNPMRARIKQHEQQFWRKKRGDLYFSAPIDTTMALYRPHVRGGWWRPALRTAPPYSARHLPWYENPINRPPDEQYYIAHAKTSSHWTQFMKRDSR